MLMTMFIIIVITIIIVLFCLFICWFVCLFFLHVLRHRFVVLFYLKGTCWVIRLCQVSSSSLFDIVVVCLPDRYVFGIPIAQRLMCWVPSSSQVSLPDGNMLGLANMPGVIQLFVFVVVVVDVVVVVVFLPDINALGLADVPDSWQV